MGSRKYYARLSYKDEGPNMYSWGVTFPDLPGCLTCADTREEAIYWAKDALELWLDTLGDRKANPPSSLDEMESNFRHDENFADEELYEFVLIEV